MSRNGSGVYSLPPGSTVTNGDTSDASDVNTPLADLEADMNIPRPVVAGGTGASSAAAALVNLGLTATAAEINVLDGITATVTELNYTDGVTSAIQTQLNAKQAAGATLTSLEGLSLVAGDLLYATAADTLARLPKGTARQALVMDPLLATAPEWASGGRFLLASKTASASATLDFTEFDAGAYRSYEFVLENVKPATDAVTLGIRFSSDGGSSYDAGASDYSYAMISLGVGGSVTPGSSSADTSIEVTTSGTVGNAAGERGVSGSITFYIPSNASEQTRIGFETQWDNAASTTLFTCRGNGVRRADQDTNAARFLFSSGNIASGVIRMYGLP